MGGGPRRGEENLTKDTPPKRGPGSCFIWYVFQTPPPPLKVIALLFSCTKVQNCADQKLLWRGPEYVLPPQSWPRLLVLGETDRIQLRRARFQILSSMSLFCAHEFWGESSVSSSQPMICVPKRTHWVSFAEFIEFGVELSLALRNRSDYCDLRLQCPVRTPKISSDFRDKTKQCCIAI